MKRYLLLVLTIVSLYIIVQQVKAAECDPNCGDANECAQKIKICQEIWDSVQKATAPHEASLKKMESDIAAFQARIKQISQEVIVKEREIASGEKELGAQQELLASRVRSAYIRSYTNNPLVLFFSQAGGFGKVMRVISYQQAVTQEDKRQIVETIALIKNIEDKKTNLENEKVTLASLEANLSVQATATKKLVDEAKAYQSKLSSQIGSLTARQQSFLAEKLAGLNLPTSLGAGPLYCTDDRKLDPGFRPAFAFFTFGIPHRVGMNQYGALGRATSGQNAEDILRAYFSNFDFVSGKEGDTVKVNGTNEFGQTFNNESMNVEDYLKHIYEMPSSWDAKALQAQAIAARSYALAEMQSKGFVYPSQKDQVIKNGYI